MAVSKHLRKGFTTGACAAAASKAAVFVLLTQKKVDQMAIRLPTGDEVEFKIEGCAYDSDFAECSVIKDAGDDPDVTHGILIKAKVTFGKSEGVLIKGGEGVGVVTKPGLPVSIGESAINPVPMKMIAESVHGVLVRLNRPKESFDVEIIVPEGRAVSKKTLNKRLGVVGGISILGTTGIVEPMSLSAYRSVIDTCIDIARASCLKEVVFTTGRSTQRIAENYLSLPENAFIQVGDHMGHALEVAANKKIFKVTILGQLGKLSKIAAGHFDTHAYKTKIDFKKAGDWAKELNFPDSVIQYIHRSNTMAQVLEFLSENEGKRFFKKVCLMVCQSSLKYVQSKNAPNYKPSWKGSSTLTGINTPAMLKTKLSSGAQRFTQNPCFHGKNMELRAILVSSEGEILADERTDG